jgi:DNA-binding response OmpR family regulator
MRLLLVEDDRDLGHVMTKALQKADFAVDWVTTGRQAGAALRSHEYDAILLDLGLPDMSGESLVMDLRLRHVATPVIVLTARGHLDDRISLLDLGADDYMVKPVEVGELAARLRAVKRRVSAGADPTDRQQIGPLVILQASRKVFWHDMPITLTSKQFDVLEVLVMRRPNCVSRSQLEEVLYGWGDEVESNAIEVYVHFLRKKFAPALVVTVRGKGYQLGAEEDLLATSSVKVTG